jgi:hypothetical protein
MRSGGGQLSQVTAPEQSHSVVSSGCLSHARAPRTAPAGPAVRDNSVASKEIDVLIQKASLKLDARNDPYELRKALHTYLDRTLSKAL